MSGMGLDWYKREPAAYLKDVQGLSDREHAVYSVILDLIYAHGGSVNNDPKWFSGWFRNLGAAAVRNTIASLVAREMLIIEGDQLTQKRARSEVKRKENFVKTQKIHGGFSEFSGGDCNENNNITPLEKRREEYTPQPPKGGGRKSVRFVGVSDEVKALVRAKG